MAGGKWNKRKGGYKKKRAAGKNRKPSVPRTMTSNSGTLFPLVRTSLLITSSIGTLDCVWAIGNISLLGPPSQKANAAGTALEPYPVQHGLACWTAYMLFFKT